MAEAAEPAAGRLYIVATPIGNLEDISYRAVRLLRSVDLIACEDTRHSRILFERYDIRRPTLSYHRLNEAQRGGELLARLQAGASIALVSDAGTPVLSDPGARLVARAVAAGVAVTPVPGASAAITALMASGVEEPVTLLGFLPARAGERRRYLEAWAGVPGSLLLFESPHRILAALADLEAVLGAERPLVLARELTKAHEQFLRGGIATVRSALEAQFAGHAGVRGEFTLVVGPAPSARTPAAPLQLPADLSKAELKRLARASGVGRSQLYRQWQQLQGKIKDEPERG